MLLGDKDKLLRTNYTYGDVTKPGMAQSENPVIKTEEVISVRRSITEYTDRPCIYFTTKTGQKIQWIYEIKEVMDEDFEAILNTINK